MNLADRTAALLDVVAQYRSERCAALLGPANADARTIVKAALAEARRRVRTAIEEERRRVQRDVGAVEASLATERRLVGQQRAARQLGSAWSALRSALSARWNAADSRRTWVDLHLARALECLAHDEVWRVRHHAAWQSDERAAADDRLWARGVRTRFQHDPSIAAGFVVACGHNVLDASLDGLLADRAALEGRLLQAMEEDRDR